MKRKKKGIITSPKIWSVAPKGEDFYQKWERLKLEIEAKYKNETLSNKKKRVEHIKN